MLTPCAHVRARPRIRRCTPAPAYSDSLHLLRTRARTSRALVRARTRMRKRTRPTSFAKSNMLHSNRDNNGQRNAFFVADIHPENHGQRKASPLLPDTRYLPSKSTLYSPSPDNPAFTHSLPHCFIESCIPQSTLYSPIHSRILPFLIYVHIASFILRHLGLVMPGHFACVMLACERHARSHARALLAKLRYPRQTSLMQTARTRVKEIHSSLRLNPAFPFHTMTAKAKGKHFRRYWTPGIRHTRTSCMSQAHTI